MNLTPQVEDTSLKVHDLIAELHALCEEWLAPHISRIETGEHCPREKVFNDPLWGSIRLFSWEVAILDSYLIQRLRFLRQLGVIHWVYPSAGHSRFEHSLGVLHQTQALLDGLERNSGIAGIRVVDNVTTKLLRISALVHDCGHTLMSHVSEPSVKRVDGVGALIDYLHRKYRGSAPPKPSEAFAAVFVTSPAFKRLLSLRRVGADFIRDIGVAVERIAGFILGAPVIPDRAFLSLIVNGAFDADKLDYMPRDCLMAGVPCAVDVRRLIEKVHCFDVPPEKLPTSYLDWARCNKTESVRILALSSSGARALDELAMTRTILFEKIYFHHKVRALEAMVRRGLESAPLKNVTGWLKLVDDDVFSEPFGAAFRHLQRRVLLKRAFVIPRPDGGSDEQKTGWRTLRLPHKQREFQDSLISMAREIASKLDMNADVLSWPTPELDIPDFERTTLDQKAFVGESVEDFKVVSAARSGQRSEAGKYAARQSAYVFAREDAILPVFLAATILLRPFAVDPFGKSYLATRLDPDVIASAVKTLCACGYEHADALTGAAPPARLRTHERTMLESFLKTAWPRLVDLGVIFGRYQSQGSPPISPKHIAEYLRQFKKDTIARSALRVLECVDFKDRAFFVGALEERLLTALGTGEVACVCPLGASGDSSVFLSYLMNDIAAQQRRDAKPLELALDSATGQGILLWDDFAGKGGHAITGLCQWLGLDDEGRLNEKLVDPLTEARISSFRKRRITICFAAARRSGVDEIRRFLTKNGLENVDVMEPPSLVAEDSRLFDTEDVLADPDERRELKVFLQDVARRVLAPKLTGIRPWSRDKLESRLLGYGNGAQLLVFFYNVPSVTLTPLWVQGDGDGGWQPLFRRRSKGPEA